jgi:HAE1 family hydrophobic/amphiphilic exporter-1
MRLFDETSRIKHPSRLMQMKRTFLLTCAAALFATALPAQNNEPPSTNQTPRAPSPVTTRKTRVMTLEECIKIALEHNLDIQIQEFNPIISQFALDVNYGAWEPTFNFTGNKVYKDTTGGLDPQTSKPFGGSVTEEDNYIPEIKGVTPWGLQYDLSGNIQRASQMGFGTYLPPDFPSTAGITLTQPLLRNFWIDKTRLQIQLSRAALKSSEQALLLQVMTTVTAVKSAYFNLLYGRDNVQAQATAYKLAQELVTENLKRVEVGALAPLDEKQSESQAAASVAAMHQAEYQEGTFENTLKSLLTDSYTEWSDVSIIPAEELVAVPMELNKQESWRRAATQRPELIEAKLSIEQQNVTLKYDKNQIFPELDVTGSYGRNATESTFDRDLTVIHEGSHSFYSYGAFVSIPLDGNYAARSTFKSDKATLKQLLLKLKQTEQNIIIAVDNDIGNVESQMQQVHATRDARVYAEEALTAEQKKLENGKSTSFIVLQLISNLTTARVAELQALANYNIAVSQLALDEGSTLEVNHIQLKVK